jgi:hypothetical protein
MSTQYHPTSVLIDDLAFTPDQVIMDHFEKTLTFCSQNWYNGKTTLVLPGNMIDFYGEAIIGYLQHCLQQCVGGAVALTTVEDGNTLKTLIEMPECNNPQSLAPVELSMPSVTETSEKDVLEPKIAIAGTKNPPRPMNMWMMYRDAQHKKMKAENPELSVQEICKYIYILSLLLVNLTLSQLRYALSSGATSLQHRRHPGRQPLMQHKRSIHACFLITSTRRASQVRRKSDSLARLSKQPQLLLSQRPSTSH